MLITSSVTGSASILSTRPYENPVAVGGGDELVWIGSTDHGNGPMHRGYSAAYDEAPTSWTTFTPPPGGVSSPETPHFVYDDTEARPFRLYWHGVRSDSGGDQQTRLASYASDWTSGTDEGEVLPATENVSGSLLAHTGYALVERRSATDWHAWSLTRSAGGVTFGYWTSADGEVWDCINDTLDITSMCDAGRRLEVSTLNRFAVGATTYAVLLERPADFGGGSGQAAGGKVVLCEMSDEQTFGTPTVLVDPTAANLADDLRDVRAVLDPDGQTVHLYIAVSKTAIYYDTHTVA